MTPSGLDGRAASADQARIDEIESLARDGGGAAVPVILARLESSSWLVRRAGVRVLAALGAAAHEPLCHALCNERSDESRIAGIVDALAGSTASPDAKMAELAAHSNPAIVCDAAQVLGRRGGPVALEVLTRLTHHADDNVALAAIEGLGRIGGRSAVDPLVELTRTRNFFRTFPAVDVLGRVADARAVPALLQLLDDPLYAAEAARALGRIGDIAAVEPLLELVLRSSESTARIAATSLSDIHARSVRMYASGATVERLVATHPRVSLVVRKLASCLRGADPNEQLGLSRVLGWTAEEHAVATLIALLDSGGEVASSALTALSQTARRGDVQLLSALASGDSERRRLLIPAFAGLQAAVAVLEECLADEDSGVRLLACRALSQSGDARVVPRLFELLADPDLGVSQAAAAAIQSLGSDETRRLALEAAASPNLSVRRAALRIVGYFGYREAFELLADALEGDDERLREAALTSLPYCEDPRVLQSLLGAARQGSPRVRAGAARALGNVQLTPEVALHLGQALSDPDPWVRYYACQSIARLGCREYTPALLERIHDPAGQVRVAAIDALAHLDHQAARAALLEAARSDDGDLRRAAIVGLSAARSPGVLPALLAALQHEDPATRLVALSSLASQASPEASHALARAAHEDVDAGVRQAAVEVLGGRAGEVATRALIDLLTTDGVADRALAALAVETPERVEAIARALPSADAELAERLVSVLARMRSEAAARALTVTLESGTDVARRAAAAALAARRDPELVPSLKRAAAYDSDPEVRRLCALAVAR